jgi:hypothetical protein
VRDPLGSTDELQTRLDRVVREAMGIAASEPSPIEKVREHEVFLLRSHRALVGDRYIAAQRIVRDWLLEQDSVAAAATREQLLAGGGGTEIEKSLRRSLHLRRSGDVLFVLAPYCMSGSLATTHGSPWKYDTHVPLMLMGKGVRPGRFDRPVSTAALAATLARILGVEPPSGSAEDPLTEALLP